MRRRLVVNADDFGFTRGVNEGIVEAHRNGILTACTLMANGAAFDHAAALALETPSLDVGGHLVLVGGESVLEPGRALPASVPRLLAEIARGRLRLYDELAAQVEKIRAAGLAPTHLDTHKHTHLAPPVLRAVMEVARAFRICWVRRTLEVPLLRGYFERLLERHGCRATDRFAGYRMTGQLDAAALTRQICGLPPGLTEFMCHPGRLTSELRQAPTRLKDSRERELAALTAPGVRQALAEAEVELVNYRKLTSS